jgi:hypothetical protein
MIATKRIYLTADRKSAVEEGDSKAAFLLAGVGAEINDKLAESLGLSGSKTVTIEEVKEVVREPEPINRTVNAKSIKRR